MSTMKPSCACANIRSQKMKSKPRPHLSERYATCHPEQHATPTAGECEAAEAEHSGRSPATAMNFVHVITETVGVVAFFIIATTMFWVAVTQYVVQIIVAISKASRTTQMIALGLVGLLFLSVSYSFVCRSVSHKPTKRHVAVSPCKVAKVTAKAPCAALKVDQAPKRDPPRMPAPYYLQARRGDKVAIMVPNPKELVRCMSKKCVETVDKNITVTISDSQARVIFKQSKIFAIPSEMKQPPAVLVYLKDVILRNY